MSDRLPSAEQLAGLCEPAETREDRRARELHQMQVSAELRSMQQMKEMAFLAEHFPIGATFLYLNLKINLIGTLLLPLAVARWQLVPMFRAGVAITAVSIAAT